MKASVASTNQFTRAYGARCRIWRGKTDRGIPFELLVPVVRVVAAEDQTAFRLSSRRPCPRRKTRGASIGGC